MNSATVFISYAHEDREAARRLYHDLKSFGVEPWLDEESLLPGQKWKVAIRKAIKRSRYFIAVLSQQSVPKRGYVQKEVREALDVLDEIPESEIYVIPIRIDDCKPSYERLSELHCVDMFPSWKEGLHKAIRAMGIEPTQELIDSKIDREVLRIGTFNMKNFDDYPDRSPMLAERISVIRPQLFRLNADVLCLQEVNGQDEPHKPRGLSALKKLLEGTPYADYQIVTTETTSGEVYIERNLVILSRFDIVESKQIKHDYISNPEYRSASEFPFENKPRKVRWERPILYVKIRLEQDNYIHFINVHLKSRLPSTIVGQQVGDYEWRTMTGLGEGLFYSIVKQAGQALEVRAFIDSIFDCDEQAKIIVCGDFNADMNDVPLSIIMGDPEAISDEHTARRNLILAQSGISDSSRYSLLHHGKGIMIDHVLISHVLLERYRYSEVHNENLHSIQAFGKVSPESDHAPIIAEFVLT